MSEERAQRPRTRGECLDGERPCPWVGCRWHLALDVGERAGTLHSYTRHSLPIRGTTAEDFEWWSDVLVARVEHASETCALDVADSGGVTLQRVATLLGVTRERVRQIEAKALRHVSEACADLGGWFDELAKEVPR